MNSYEEIKSKAPSFMMLVQKSRMLLQQGKIEEAYQVADESLDALDLIEEYPNTLAAYVVAANVFRNYAEVLEKYAYYAVPTGCTSVIHHMAPFLSKYPQDENCMSMLLSIIMPLYVNVMRIISEGDSYKSFTIDGRDYTHEVVSISASMIYSVYRALKSVSPGSPMISAVQEYISEIPDSALIFHDVSGIPEYTDRLRKIIR